MIDILIYSLFPSPHFRLAYYGPSRPDEYRKGSYRDMQSGSTSVSYYTISQYNIL